MRVGLAEAPAVTDAEVGLAEIKKSGDPPVPESETSCGLPLALSAMDTEAVRVPVADGLNVTAMLQSRLQQRLNRSYWSG